MPHTHVEKSSSPRKQLVLMRAGVTQRFGGVLFFLVILFLALGGYQLAQAVTHPLDAQATEIISAAVLIALAFVILFQVIEAHSMWYANWRTHRRHRAYIVRNSFTVAELLVRQRLALQAKLPFVPVNRNRHPADYR